MSSVPTEREFNALNFVVGSAAILAPALHTLTDALEWYRQGFSTTQLWISYLAFLPMPWLLLGLYAVHKRAPSAVGLVGAILYGAAFTYFAHTALFALAERTPDYEALWARLGPMYTIHGALMVIGGLLFAWSVLRAGWLPKPAVWLFTAGVLLNLVLALVPAPVILQTVGTVARSAGLIVMGYAVLVRSKRRAA